MVTRIKYVCVCVFVAHCAALRSDVDKQSWLRVYLDCRSLASSANQSIGGIMAVKWHRIVRAFRT